MTVTACKGCDGKGTVTVKPDRFWNQFPCRACDGTGEIEAEFNGHVSRHEFDLEPSPQGPYLWLDDKGRWHCSECGVFVSKVTDDHEC